MCGRYTLTAPDQLAMRFDLADPAEATSLEPRYNVAPTQAIPVVVERDDGRHLAMMRWGYQVGRPSSSSRSPDPINARAETLLERPLFRNAVIHRRCLIPADGFYEWASVPNRSHKQPVYFRLRDGDLFAFAGLYAERVEDGHKVASCALITTTPNTLVTPVHNRMPAILERDVESLWLDPDVTTPDALLACLHPYRDDLMESYAVSSDVSSARNEGAALIAPLSTASMGRFAAPPA